MSAMTDRTFSYVLCVENSGYPASLELRKVYRRLPDRAAESDGFVRVVDESGEDYLFPARFFAAIELPQTAERAFAS